MKAQLYLVSLLIAGVTILVPGVNSSEPGIDWIKRFLYQPVSSWGTNIVMGKQECPDYNVTKGFRQDKLIGEWYVVARSESVMDETGQCTKKKFHAAQDGTLTMTTTEQHVDRVTGKFGAKGEGKEGMLRRHNISQTDGEFEFKVDRTPYSQWAPFSVLDTDTAGTYLIVYSCQMTYGGLIQLEQFWTLSHKPLDSQNDRKEWEQISSQGQKVFEDTFDDFKYNVTMEEVIQGGGSGAGDQCVY